MTKKDWNQQSDGAYVCLYGTYAVTVESAWALLRVFRTGEMFDSPETRRQWAEEEYAAFLEREKTPKPFKPHLVPV